MELNVINVRKQPEYKEQAIAYFQKRWGNRSNKKVYEDCILNSIVTDNPLPVWYLLMDADNIIGCVGLITNDFISRMDLWPWLCALFVEKKYRGQNLSALLIEQLKIDCAEAGFESLYLATDHIGLYEKHGFDYIADGYHPWGDVSRIYEIKV
ncbi:MAG: GNAT family N-acetyltransferase [Turicibacter sp.]|nr:GNAT family N-acetyltransferase [Turicibacter sp.]